MSNFDKPLQQFVGRVGRDPEVRDTSRGPVTKFSIAVSDGYGEGANTTWYNVATFNDGLQASIQNEITKGAVVAVEGTVTQKGDYDPDILAVKVGLITWLDRSKGAPAQQRQAPAPAPTSDDF